jgi:hypothetical protein
MQAKGYRMKVLVMNGSKFHETSLKTVNHIYRKLLNNNELKYQTDGRPQNFIKKRDAQMLNGNS